MRLKGRVAIVTGAGTGIGLAYAERFVQEGAAVVIAEVSEDRGARAARRLEHNGDVLFLQTDIADERSAADCVQRTVERYTRVSLYP